MKLFIEANIWCYYIDARHQEYEPVDPVEE